MLQHLQDSDNNDDDKKYLHRRMYTVWWKKNGLIKENLHVLAMGSRVKTTVKGAHS